MASREIQTTIIGMVLPAGRLATPEEYERSSNLGVSEAFGNDRNISLRVYYRRYEELMDLVDELRRMHPIADIQRVS